MGLRGRDRVGVPVAGAPARGVDDARHARPAAALEEVEPPDHVDAGVEGGVGDGAAHRRLRGEVGHRLRPLGLEHVAPGGPRVGPARGAGRACP